MTGVYLLSLQIMIRYVTHAIACIDVWIKVNGKVVSLLPFYFLPPSISCFLFNE